MKRNRISGRLLGRQALCLLLLALLLLAGAAPAHGEAALSAVNASGNLNLPLAVDPIEDEEGYFAILYDNRNGMPTSEANAIAQTGDGFLWIGSYAGLIRYDGNSFERVAYAEGILNTRCLYVDSRDRLWVGTNDLGVFLMTKDSFRRVEQPEQAASVSIRSLAEDSAGTLYAGTAAGVFTIGEDLKAVAVADERLAARTIAELRAGEGGLVCGITQEGDFFTLKDGQLLSFLEHEALGMESIQAILPDPARPGSLYLAAEDSAARSARIYHGSPEDRFASAESVDIRPLSYVVSLELLDGELWICADNGIGKLSGGRLQLMKNVPMDKSVGHVMTDYEGNLWFTSSRQCVMKIVPNRFLDLFARCDLPADVVNATCMLGDRLFIGTDDSGLIVLEDGKALESLPLTGARTASGQALDIPDLLAYLKTERIRSLLCDREGRLWICTWRHQHGLLRYDKGELVCFTAADGMLSNQVRTVSECADGTILAAQPDGLSLIRGDRVVAGYGAGDGLSVTSILTVTEGFHGEKILGTDGGGIYVLDAEGMRHIGLADGLKSEVIMRIKPSSSRSLYWIATGNSIAYMTPDYRVTTVEHFPYSNNYDFYESSSGDLWVLSSNGIYVVSAGELLANGPIHAVFYGVSGGLPYFATANSFSELTEDGELYMAGVNGTVRVNLNKPFAHAGKLKLALPYIDIDGKRSFPDEAGNFFLPRGAKKLTIYPYVFSNALSDISVSYRLEGFDAAELTVDRSELTPLTYTNLPAGTYRFVLRAADSTGGDSASASCQIVREKALSEGGVGTIIMDVASLFLLVGVSAYTAPFRRRGQLNDRLLFAMILINASMAILELCSFLLEKTVLPFTRALMLTYNTVFYALLALFLYLMLLYVEYVSHRDPARFRKAQLAFALPCLLFFLLLLVNLKTGWLFSITKRNAYRSGSADQLIFVPLVFYYLVLLYKVSRIDWRLVPIGLLLIGTRILWDIWYIGISSISFIFTLFLLGIFLFVIDRAMYSEGVAK